MPRTNPLHVNLERHCMGRKKENKELCIANSRNVEEYATRFAPGHWSFLGPRSETKWHGTHEPNGEMDNVAEIVMINFCDSGHPVFEDPVLSKEEI